MIGTNLVLGTQTTAAIEPGKTATLIKGDYVGGVDIPADTYVLKCETGDSDYGIVWLSAESDNLKEEYPSRLYEFVSGDSNCYFFISLEEGGTLHVPFKYKLSAVDYTSDEIDELYEGSYVGGMDLPVGKYLVSVVALSLFISVVENSINQLEGVTYKISISCGHRGRNLL